MSSVAAIRARRERFTADPGSIPLVKCSGCGRRRRPTPWAAAEHRRICPACGRKRLAERLAARRRGFEESLESIPELVCPKCGRGYRPRAWAAAKGDKVCRDCRRLDAGLARQRKGLPMKMKAKRRPLAEAPAEARGFMDWCKLEKNLAPMTLKSYAADLRALAAFAGARPLAALTKAELREFQRASMQQGSAATVHRRIAVLRMFYKWLQIEDRRVDNPADALVRPRLEHRLPSILTEGEADALVLSAGLGRSRGRRELAARDTAVVELLYSCGLRAEEICTLKMEHVDLKAGLLHIQGKGRRDRIVPLAPVSGAALQAYATGARAWLARDRDAGTVFLTRNGMQLCRRDVWRIVKLAQEKAGITRRVYPHLVRHTAATALVRGGAHIASVQAFLGHSSLQTTTRYVHLAAEDVKREYLKAHPRARVQLVAPAARRLTAAPRPSR